MSKHEQFLKSQILSTLRCCHYHYHNGFLFFLFESYLAKESALLYIKIWMEDMHGFRKINRLSLLVVPFRSLCSAGRRVRLISTMASAPDAAENDIIVQW